MKIGRGGGIRTHDPLLPKQMREPGCATPRKKSPLYLIVFYLSNLFLQIIQIVKNNYKNNNQLT